ncbi:hypothetical protein EXW53_26795 (plasmid) [Bacillus mycoides]|uniref:hypothetical protein n=1 Tax=Bacillus mycoides TaxID=1405 RepID=UPI001C022205|nr:hypothetical protein [Bacillus mycoides]QWH42885.1 hypothetical protein EXW53_26795 [Bacillus mycoides]
MENHMPNHLSKEAFSEEVDIYIKEKKDVSHKSYEASHKLKDFNDVSRQMYDAINAATKDFAKQLDELDWNGIMKDCKESAEKLGERGWTVPLCMTPGEIVECSKTQDIDTAMEKYFSNEREYSRMKRDVLNHKLVRNWKVLLKQCFNSFENGNYLVTIPNLFIILEGIARMLISQKFEKNQTANRTSLKNQYKKVSEDLYQEDETKDRVYLVAYVSVLGFLNQVFQQGNFDKNPTRFSIINRDWVLHGKDNPDNWEKVDALRLFNAIYSLTAVGFLLKKSEELPA